MRQSILSTICAILMGIATVSCTSTQTTQYKTTLAPTHVSTLESATTPAASIPSLIPNLLGTPTAPQSPTQVEQPTLTRIEITSTHLPSPLPGRATPSGLQAPGKAFDISYVTTRTALPSAQCPVADPNKKPAYQKFETLFGLLPDETGLLEQLNAGVPGQAIIEDIEQGSRQADSFIEQDLTGDNVPEFLAARGMELYIFSCAEGKYQTLWKKGYEVSDPPPLHIAAITDMNLNGLPEIVTEARTGSGLISLTAYDILEWNGATFQNMVTQPDFEPWYPNGGGYVVAGSIWMDGMPPEGGIYDKVDIVDIDGNGTRDLIITGGIGVGGDALAHGPWRWEKDVYTWNGQGFVLQNIEIEKPTYRFQAVQDADMYFYAGRYDVALDLYQQAIFSDQLDWWSLERAIQLRSQDPYGPTPELTPTAMPADPNDYDNLAAYSRFRIVLLHLVQGYTPEAEIVYNQLQESFPAGQTGSAYAALAASFWDTYQATGELSAACSQAIAYAAENPQAILDPIGNYHGFQSFIYQPEDICPIR